MAAPSLRDPIVLDSARKCHTVSVCSALYRRPDESDQRRHRARSPYRDPQNKNCASVPHCLYSLLLMEVLRVEKRGMMVHARFATLLITGLLFHGLCRVVVSAASLQTFQALHVSNKRCPHIHPARSSWCPDTPGRHARQDRRGAVLGHVVTHLSGNSLPCRRHTTSFSQTMWWS